MPMNSPRRSRAVVDGFSLYEVGRSELGQALPRHFNGHAAIWRYLLAGSPLVLLGAGVGLRTTVFAQLGDFRGGYILATVLMLAVSASLFVHASRARAYNGLQLRYLYAQEHLVPALHYSGALAGVEATVRLLDGQVVELDPTQNLYGADMMRLVHLRNGHDMIQFERA